MDASAFLGRWPFRPIEGTVAGLARMMRANEISHALVSPFEGLFYADPEPANEELLSKIAGRKGLWAAPIINLRIAEWREQMARLVRSRQVRAYRLAPTFHGYQVTECAEAAREAARLRRALMVQVRLEDERHLSPILELPPASVKEVVGIARSVPRAMIVVSAARLPEVLGVAEKVKRLRNLWFDMSHFDGLECMRQACKAVGAKRLLFSTSWPFFYARSAVLKVEEAGLRRSEQQAVWGVNGRRVLELGRMG
jgi:predicted TIM-barrel fold metal-dependent hydrolase